MFLYFYAARVFLSLETIHHFEKILTCIKAIKENTEVALSMQTIIAFN
jgi:hypothetical protein